MHQYSVLRTFTTPILLLSVWCSQNCIVLLLLTKLPQLKYKLTIKKHNKPDNWVNTSHYRTPTQLTRARGGGRKQEKLRKYWWLNCYQTRQERARGPQIFENWFPSLPSRLTCELAWAQHWQRCKLAPISVTSGTLNLIVKSSVKSLVLAGHLTSQFRLISRTNK